MSSLASEVTLGEVFIANRPQLWRLARRIIGTSDLADDVVQDAYLRVVNSPFERKADRPLSYCCQVVRNMAFDYCRHHKTESTYRDFDADVEIIDVAGPPSPERLMCERQVLVQLDRALGRLAPRTRRVFEMYRLEGLTQRDIAQRLGCALGLVNGLISQAADAIQSCAHMLDDE